MAAIAAAAAGGLGALALSPRAFLFLDKSEQAVVEHFSEVKVLNGPGLKLLNPLGYKKATKRKAEILNTVDFAFVKDGISGEERVERGPQLLFLGAYDAVTSRGEGTTLSKTEYIIVDDRLTGERTLVKGPCVWFPSSPFSVSGGKRTAIALQEDEYVRIKDKASGKRWVQRGKATVFLEPTWEADGRVRKAITLKSYEFVRLLNSLTGKVTVHKGEAIVVPSSDEELLDGDKLEATDLSVGEFVRLEDQTTGEIRVVAGPERVFLGPNEKVLDGGKQQAVQVDDENAVLVRDLRSGQLRLCTEKRLFVPGPCEAIEEVKRLIRLSAHEALITKDKDGQLHFHYGDAKKNKNDEPTAFFLPPHEEVNPLWWSSGLRRERRDLRIEVFDCRAQYMWFEFDTRTSDNVELILEVTMFWQVLDLPKMVSATGNLPGDIFNQARSQFIKHVARVTLKAFMEQLHTISNRIHEEDLAFYDSRGVQIFSLEVTRYKCAEHRTSEVLQQIIEETTNRLNRLSQAESENEVKLFRMQGQIEQEKLNGELLEIQQKHLQSDARVAGAAEAERVSAFVDGLEKEVPSLEDRINMWQVLRKKDALSVVSEGGGSLYYTPQDVNLSIRTEK